MKIKLVCFIAVLLLAGAANGADVALPVADFAANVTEGVAPLTVEFGPTLLNDTTNNGVWWAENESGLIYTYGSQYDPYYYRVVFDLPGVYDVGMRATGPGGTTWVNKTDYVTVLPLRGDLNQNGRLDFADVTGLYNGLGGPYKPWIDMNNNGRLDFADVNILFAML